MDITNLEEDRYHVAATSSLTAGGARVLKADDTFALLNRFGDLTPAGEGEHGLYHAGTRYLSRLELRVAGRRPMFLSSGMLADNIVLAVEVSNPDLAFVGDSGIQNLFVPYGTLHIARWTMLSPGLCSQRLTITNHGTSAIQVPLSLHFAADFADIFEVRGTARERRGQQLPAELNEQRVSLEYRGLDQVTRRASIGFEPTPKLLSATEAHFLLKLDAKETTQIELQIACETDTRSVEVRPFDAALIQASLRSEERQRRECKVRTSNEVFNRWLDRSCSDLHMLTAHTPYGPYPYAGVPWFSAPFGRDGIWTAIQTLWLSPSYAAGVLRFLSATQSDERDDARDAEPGKIVHEIREGEMAALGEIPFGRYYGSVDSTPLFLMLAAHYYRSTGDIALIKEVWPRLLRALEWVDRYGDQDGDGFVEYGRRSSDGLVQQGWKDSNDSVFHADGSLAPGPIALCEVQAYAYAARTGMALLAQAMHEPELASRFERQADELRQRFDAAFWCEDLGTYALALDGAKRPCRVRSSNAGHCLYTGIALPERAAVLRSELLAEDMFSGWGVRTLSSREVRYNPMSYHNGSIWPHDNAIIAEGIAAYGYRSEASEILSGLFGASTHVELQRLPELFCGFSRKNGQGPTLYPVACSPQAWAAGSVLLLLKAVLGMDVDALEQRVTFRSPMLPETLDEVWISNLRVGAASIDMRLQRYPRDVGVTVLDKTGDVQIVTLR
jgi:glycogen debranching enzyme